MGMAAGKDTHKAVGLPALGAWINERHLSTDAVRRLRAELESDPARALVVRDFLRSDVAMRLNRFLTEEAEFERIFSLNSDRKTKVGEDEWLAAEEGDRFYRFGRLSRASAAFSPNLLTFLRFRAAFNGEAFTEFLRQATGLQLGASQLSNTYSFQRGDFLSRHTDVDATRRLAVVLNLSRDWQPDFGGELHMVDSRGAVTRVPAEFNSLVLFDVLAGGEHYVSVVKPEAGDRRRLTISGWVHDRPIHGVEDAEKQVAET
jgi:Rps23 Pro-64 3,4-dihydroxylase Tpa1-like proline 4-hydroxylase